MAPISMRDGRRGDSARRWNQKWRVHCDLDRVIAPADVSMARQGVIGVWKMGNGWSMKDEVMKYLYGVEHR